MCIAFSVCVYQLVLDHNGVTDYVGEENKYAVALCTRKEYNVNYCTKLERTKESINYIVYMSAELGNKRKLKEVRVTYITSKILRSIFRECVCILAMMFFFPRELIFSFSVFLYAKRNRKKMELLFQLFV